MDKQALYLGTIKEAYPDLEVRSARLHTGEGQFNDILLVNGDLIFRFPRYEERIGIFLRELDTLKRLKADLSLPIPDPVYISTGKSGAGRAFMGYKILPGRPLFRDVLAAITDGSIQEGFASQLAGFLRGLHVLSPAELGLDLPRIDQLAEARRLYTGIQEHLFPSMRPDARESVIRHFESYFKDSSLHHYEPCLIHGDFGGSNILFEGERITGVIDWSSTGLSDPAVDIAALSTFGETFFAYFCKQYAPSDDMLARARFYRGTFGLEEALDGFIHADQEAYQSGMEQYL